MRRQKINKERSVRCQCGQLWQRCYYENSGTTEIRLACPHLVDYWGDNPYVWRRSLEGHQFVVSSTAEHASTGCCDVWKVCETP